MGLAAPAPQRHALVGQSAVVAHALVAVVAILAVDSLLLAGAALPPAARGLLAAEWIAPSRLRRHQWR